VPAAQWAAGRASSRNGLIDWVHEDLAIAVAANTVADVTNFEQTWAAWLQDPDSTTGPNAQFCHAANPRRFAANVGHVSPFVGLQQVEGEKFA